MLTEEKYSDLQPKHFRQTRSTLWVLSILLLLISGCVMKPPMKTVDYVDLERFMGDWYVVANIPTPLEKGAHNAVENYELNPDGTIATTFYFRKKGFNGPEKSYQPKGFVKDQQSNALWGMQFIWPFKGDFRIVYLTEDYGMTVIGRKARDYVWVMKRVPEFSDDELRSMKVFIRDLGYDAEKLQRVPQQWPQGTEVES